MGNGCTLVAIFCREVVDRLFNFCDLKHLRKLYGNWSKFYKSDDEHLNRADQNSPTSPVSDLSKKTNDF